MITFLDHVEDKLKRLLEGLNNFDLCLKFTNESRKQILPFLDLKIKFCDGKIRTDLYIKETDRHQYLHYSSSHPHNTKWSIVLTQVLQLKRICSEVKDFQSKLAEMRLSF